MTRYKITIEYDGINFAGWQRQSNAPSIQQCIEEAIEKFSRETPSIYGSGRTDAGVHAHAQVAHFDLEKEYTPQSIIGAINHFIKPHRIVITHCEITSNDFHARFSAKKRHYRYLILNRNAPSSLDANRSWHIRAKLNIEAMQLAADSIIGQHDFTSFRATHCQALSPIKTLDEIKIYQQDEQIIITIKARSFLYHMVRNIVGTLIPIGLGKLKIEEMSKILKSKDRKNAKVTAPAHGLYFSMVEYENTN